MIEVTRQGMVKTVTVREYEDEAKFIKVTIKAPTELPLAQWQSGSGNNRHTDEIDMAFPLDAQVRPGDMVAFRVQIVSPVVESTRFRPALEATFAEAGNDDVLDVMVEDGMIEKGTDDYSDDSGADVDGGS